MYSKKRVDNNQKQVVKELRELGFSVALTHTIGNGFPDFIISYGIISVPVELKSSGGKLTKDEKEFHENFSGGIVIAFNTKDCLVGFSEYVSAIYQEKQEIQEQLNRLIDKIK